jgi:predicted RNA-binding Zn ribbon-like protein
LIFAPDTEVTLQWTAALVNTRPSPVAPDALATVEDLLAHMAGWSWTGSMPEDDHDLAQVRRVRDRLRRLWDVEVLEAVDLVNALLRDGRALPQLVIHEPFGWHIHGTDNDAPIAVRMAVDAAMAMIDVIRTDSLSRLRLCEGEDCENVLIDLSKNQSRKFCDTACANRAHAAAYRARLKESTP